MERLILSSFQAKPLLTRQGVADRARSSFDLNLTKVEVGVAEEGVLFPQGLVRWALLEKIAREERKVFEVFPETPHPSPHPPAPSPVFRGMVGSQLPDSGHGKTGEGEEMRALQIFSESTSWVRSLCPTEAAPTVLVSGIPMHRIKDTDPVQDTRAKIKALGMQKGRVLDTATGLGYTAIQAARTASEVVTVELDPAAIELARLNPWSAELFSRQNITQIIGDSVEVIPEMPSGSFSAVIHDPPTMSLGGELYSEDFYKELRRVLSRNGRLFHYICDPDSSLGKKLWPGVIRRLNAAGFKRIERHPEAYGLTATAGS